MSDTYSQLYIQMIFAVKGRKNLIPKAKKEMIHKYISGIVANKKHKMLAIHCMPDHIHIFVGLNPSVEPISNLVKEIKTSSDEFIRKNKIVKDKFYWQEGFGAFSYSKSQLDAVIKYINNQETYHARKSFKEEFLEFLKIFEIEYEEKYLFDWILE